uniref:ferredoxin-thioredoxin reductase, variable chain-like n=1 Tax=Erigeron canadensis TaxID=72917 RepID=UPI001CB9C74D|nr:ferredoxin-thioredoxin reductase, variable chain-like [Erigeron canadensis]
MTSPAILAAGTTTAVNSPPSTISNSLITRSLHPYSRNHYLTNPNPNFNRSNHLQSLKSATADSKAAIADTPIPSPSPDSSENKGSEKIGARVRVRVPLKVYHVPKVPEFELKGKEGKIKDYVSVFKGKHISANLPYKIEFFEILEGRGEKPVKFFVHLKDDEFEYID